MTTIQLRAELFREINPLLDSESAMTKVLAYVKSLVGVQQKEDSLPTRKGWAEAAKRAHAEGHDKLMMDDVFTDDIVEDWKW